MAADEQRQGEEPWYSDCDDAYAGCAMPIGQKAAFWRQYWATTLHTPIDYRSDLDALLRDFAAVEQHYRSLVEEYGMRVTYCEFWCERAPWGVRHLRRLTRWLKTLLPITRRDV